MSFSLAVSVNDNFVSPISFGLVHGYVCGMNEVFFGISTIAYHIFKVYYTATDGYFDSQLSMIDGIFFYNHT